MTFGMVGGPARISCWRDGRLPGLLFLLLILLAGAGPSPAMSAQNRPLVTLAGPFSPDSFRGRWYQLLYTEAFDRLGRDFRYLQLPLRRATWMVRKGLIDGETGRVGSYLDASTRLRLVPVRLWTARVIAVSADPRLRVSSWRDLKNVAGIIDYRSGVWILEQDLPRIIPANRLNTVARPEQGLERLMLGRSSLLVGIDAVVDRAWRRPDFRNAGLFRAGTLAELPIYPFLVKKDEALIGRLARVLKEMREQGLFQRYERLAEAHVSEPGGNRD